MQKKEESVEVNAAEGKSKEPVDEKGRILDVEAQEFIPGVQPPIPLNSTMSVYGKRRSGKSVFLRWFVDRYIKYYIPWYYCFTHTKHNMFFEGFMPAKFVIPQFSAFVLQTIMDGQALAIKTFLAQPEDHPNPFNPRVCVFWDDYNGKDIVFNDKLKDYYYTGR